MWAYLSAVQIGHGFVQAGLQTKPTGNETMSALTNLGRVFDTSVAVVFVLISLSLAGATAVVGV